MWIFFKAVSVIVLLYGCFTWALTISMEKRPDKYYNRTQHAVLKKHWKQH